MKCDISKYFDSISHKILLKVIKKKIADKKVLWLVEEILNSSEVKPGIGIPIGNLTSQVFANIYLNELDQFVKHRLRIKYYVRYMDDFLILGSDKKTLHRIKGEIRKFLQERLKLELHPKKANIFPVHPVRYGELSNGTSEGIDWLGYKIFRTHRLLRKSTVKRFIRRTKSYQKRLKQKAMSQEKFNQSLQSWIAYSQFANSWKLRKNLGESLKVNLTTKPGNVVKI